MPRAFRKLLPILCVLYALGSVAYWLLIRYLGDRWWPATVLLFAPRWPLLLPLLVLLPLSVRRKKLSWLPLLTALFICGPLLGVGLPWRKVISKAPAGQPIRILFCNVHREELNRPAFDAYLLEVKPQVVLLQDYRSVDTTPVLRDPLWHKYRIGEIFIASQFPITHVHDLHLERIAGDDDKEVPRRFGTAASFDLQTPGGTLRVVNLHLTSPHGGLRALAHKPSKGIRRLETNSVRRQNESQQITDWLSTQSGPFVVAGDFNTPSESPIFRYFWSRYPDAFSVAGFGLGFTHLSPFSELRIDHLLTGPEVTCTDYRVGPPCGTPHRPILADLILHPGS